MALCIIVEGGVGELVEQAQRFALIVPVLAVLEREVGELAPIVGPAPVPAARDDAARDRAGSSSNRSTLTGSLRTGWRQISCRATDRKSTRLNSSHQCPTRIPLSALKKKPQP